MTEPNAKPDELRKEVNKVLDALRHPYMPEQMEAEREIVFSSINRKIDADEKPVSGQKNKNRLYLHYFRIASVILLFLLPSVALTYYLGYESGTQNQAQTYIETTVPAGIISKLTLQDGTKVVLNGGSRLVYPATFYKERKVFLSGEGYFDVARDEEKSFIVGTNNLNVRVLGTRFSFKNYKEDEEVVLTLESGSIDALPENETKGWEKAIRMNPEDQIVMDKQTGRVQKKQVQTVDYTSWKDGILTFRDQTLQEIVIILQRKFDRKIEILTDELKDERYGAQFRYNETVEQILEKLSTKRQWKYEMEDGVIRISKKL